MPDSIFLDEQRYMNKNNITFALLKIVTPYNYTKVLKYYAKQKTYSSESNAVGLCF